MIIVKSLHNGKINPDFKGKRKGQLKYATQMNGIRKQLLRIYPDAIETFGMVTKANRLKLGVEKDHHIDACVIAGGGNAFSFATNMVFLKRGIPKGDFQKTKGLRSEQPITTGKIQGFRKFDKVEYFGREYFIKGRISQCHLVRADSDRAWRHPSAMPVSTSSRMRSSASPRSSPRTMATMVVGKRLQPNALVP